jgi:hypothetical protein
MPGSRESNQDDARVVQMPDESEPTKVLVLCEQNPALIVRHFHYLPVNRSLLKFADGRDIVPIRNAGP